MNNAFYNGFHINTSVPEILLLADEQLANDTVAMILQVNER